MIRKMCFLLLRLAYLVLPIKTGDKDRNLFLSVAGLLLLFIGITMYLLVPIWVGPVISLFGFLMVLSGLIPLLRLTRP
jgi:hypothetical protein